MEAAAVPVRTMDAVSDTANPEACASIGQRSGPEHPMAGENEPCSTCSCSNVTPEPKLGPGLTPVGATTSGCRSGNKDLGGLAGDGEKQGDEPSPVDESKEPLPNLLSNRPKGTPNDDNESKQNENTDESDPEHGKEEITDTENDKDDEDQDSDHDNDDDEYDNNKHEDDDAEEEECDDQDDANRDGNLAGFVLSESDDEDDEESDAACNEGEKRSDVRIEVDGKGDGRMRRSCAHGKRTPLRVESEGESDDGYGDGDCADPDVARLALAASDILPPPKCDTGQPGRSRFVVTRRKRIASAFAPFLPATRSTSDDDDESDPPTRSHDRAAKGSDDEDTECDTESDDGSDAGDGDQDGSSSEGESPAMWKGLCAGHRSHPVCMNVDDDDDDDDDSEYQCSDEDGGADECDHGDGPATGDGIVGRGAVWRESGAARDGTREPTRRRSLSGSGVKRALRVAAPLPTGASVADAPDDRSRASKRQRTDAGVQLSSAPPSAKAQCIQAAVPAAAAATATTTTTQRMIRTRKSAEADTAALAPHVKPNHLS